MLTEQALNMVLLVAEEGGFDYVAGTYADDLPCWTQTGGRDQLIVPYTLDCDTASILQAF